MSQSGEFNKPMITPRFFGYGSLVNTSTHIYPNPQRARVAGWRRVWRHTALRDIAFLTAVRAEGSAIDGLIADVPGADWQALDDRETGYDRTALGAHESTVASPGSLAIYAISEDKSLAPTVQHPILLSYLDVVVQGYFQQFGKDGVDDFFATTDGWDAPILNDRAAPIYPRHRILSADESSIVDDAISTLGCTVLRA